MTEEEYIKQLCSEIKALKEALRFYAEETHLGYTDDTRWEREPDPSFKLLGRGYTEDGSRARKALGLDGGLTEEVKESLSEIEKKSENLEHRELGK